MRSSSLLIEVRLIVAPFFLALRFAARGPAAARNEFLFSPYPALNVPGYFQPSRCAGLKRREIDNLGESGYYVVLGRR